MALGRIALRLSFFTMSLYLWNNLVMGDEEDELPDDLKNSPHIVLGRNQKGEVIYFSRLGALSDVMEWFGLDTLYQDISDVIDKRVTLEEYFSDKIQTPINKLIQGITPYIKIPVEWVMGKSLFPNAFNPGTIRDTGLWATNTFGLDEEYRRIAGLPVKESYIDSWQEALIYRSDPKANAYYKVLDLKRQYEKSVQGKYPSQAYTDSPKSKALYNLKLSLKYGDKEAYNKYLNEYLDAGGTMKGMKISLATLSPLYGLNAQELSGFYSWLKPEEREVVKKAVSYYVEVLGGDKPKEPKNTTTLNREVPESVKNRAVIKDLQIELDKLKGNSTTGAILKKAAIEARLNRLKASLP